MIEELGRQKSTKFTRKETAVDKTIRSPFFDSLEEIGEASEIKEFKWRVMIKWPYQCGFAVYQLAKLRMLEFYFDFLGKYFSRQDLCYMDIVLHGQELCYMDTDSFYVAISGDSLDEIVRFEMKHPYEADKKKCIATGKFSERTPGLFKAEFVDTRGMWLIAKCYFVQNQALNENKSAAKVFQANIMICIFSTIKMSWMFY